MTMFRNRKHDDRRAAGSQRLFTRDIEARQVDDTSDKKHKLERQAIDGVATRLAKKYPKLPEAHIAEVVESQYAKMSSARLRDYIPVLVEHAAKQALHDEEKSSKKKS